MAESVVKLRIDSQEYDAKLKKASQALSSYFDTVRQGGGTLTQLDEGVMDAVKALGEMSTVANTTKGGMREMSQAITDLTIQYRALTDEEKASPLGAEMEKSIKTLIERAGKMKDAMVDVEASIKNASSDTRVFDQLAGGANVLMSSFQTLQGASKLLGIEMGDNVEVIAKLQAAMAVTSGLTQVQTALQKQSAVMQGVQTVQTMALAAANAAAASSITGATVAQAAFNAVANANPYVLLATAVIAVGTALAAFASSSSKAKEEAEELAKAEEEAAKKAEDARNSFVNAAAESMNTAGRISALQVAYKNANSELEKTSILKQAQAEFKKLGLECNSLTQAQNLLVQNGGKVIEMIRLQGEAAASAAARLEIFKQKFAQYMATTGDSTYSYYLANGSKEVQDLDKLIISQQGRLAQLKGSLGGGGGRGRSGGGGRGGNSGGTTDTNFAADSIMAQEKLVNALTDKWKRASGELRDGYLRELEAAKKLLDQMTNTKPIEGGDKGEVTVSASKMPSILKKYGESGTSTAGLDTLISDLKSQISTADLGSELWNNLTAQLKDATLMQSVLETAIKAGIDGAQLDSIATNLKDKLLSGDIPDSTWATLQEEINAKLEELGIEPIVIDLKTGSIETVKKDADSAKQSFQDAASAVRSVGSALQSIEDPGIKVAGIIAEAVANIALGFSKASAVEGTKGIFAWIAASAAGLATMVSTISAVKSATSTQKFSEGGIVRGTSYSGDNIAMNGGEVRVNAGELILTRAQQGAIAEQLQGGGGLGGELTARVTAEDIIFILNNNGLRRGYGKFIND